jgi:hypothetical protein
MPDIDTAIIEKLLNYGADPKELYQGYSIWRYRIHYVHVLKGIRQEDTCLRVFKMMLQHGADPSASCIQENSAWMQGLHMEKVDISYYGLPNMARLRLAILDLV